MREVLARLPRARVVVLGDVVVDRYVVGTTNRISREAPVPVVNFEREFVKPGGAANAAVNVVALGARCHLVGVVGRDAAASALRSSLRGTGVSPVLVVERGRATAEKLRVLAGAQGTRAQQVLRLDRDPAGPPLRASMRAAVEGVKKQLASGAGALLLSDYGGGLVHDDVVSPVVALARAGLPVVVDSRFMLGRISGPVILKPNAPELAELVNAPVKTAEDVLAAARVVLRRQHARAVVATRGRDGMLILEKGQAPAFIPAHGTGEVTDVTGAGDTVAAALCAALAAGVGLLEAARLANVAASVVVGKLGAATATPAEVLAALQDGGATP